MPLYIQKLIRAIVRSWHGADNGLSVVLPNPPSPPLKLIGMVHPQHSVDGIFHFQNFDRDRKNVSAK